jgi:hypothetical protein
MGKTLDLRKRITTLEAEKEAAVLEGKRHTALERALGFLPWQSDYSRDLARNLFESRVEGDKEFTIEGVALDDAVITTIRTAHANLLVPEQSAAGAQKEIGGKTAAKPATDFDALNALSSREELAAAAKELAAVLAKG